MRETEERLKMLNTNQAELQKNIKEFKVDKECK
jgi:hypothetical protein